MKIRRFVARDMRTALLQIKEELGADAVIMSNKKIPEGVELMAAVDYSQSVDKPSENAASSAADSVEATSPLNRPMNEDKVTLGQSAALNESIHPQQPTMPVGSNNLTENTTAANTADSLSALLNRKVQQDAFKPSVSVNQTNQTAQTGQANSQVPDVLGQDDIEQQFKSFTERLQQSTYADGNASLSQEVPDNQQMPNIGSAHTVANQFTQPNTNVNQESPNSVVAGQADIVKMQNEMASIRQLLEHQISGLMWQDMAQKDPARALLVDRLTGMGLTEQVADQVAGYVPSNINENEGWQYALKSISDQINTTNNDIIHRGGVVALVGPTGVGKTTTIAKLAARFAQIHGADQVAMISTDSYRIAGFEQLSTYGRIIGCQVKLAQDDAALDVLLQQYSKKKLVLIDTAGMGQRDMRLAENLTKLITNARVKIRNYLVLAANTQQRVMQENVDRFKKVPLSGCIYTKLDESLSVGEIISTSIQNGLPIGYLTDGQRVPEDIKVANAEKLVNLADKMALKYSAAGSFANQASWKNSSHAATQVA